MNIFLQKEAQSVVILDCKFTKAEGDYFLCY